RIRTEAKSYLDWIGPALIRHQDALALRGEEGSVLPHEEEWNTDSSSWQVEVLPAVQLLDVEEEQVMSKENLQAAIEKWEASALPNSLGPVIDVEEILDYEYPHKQ